MGSNFPSQGLTPEEIQELNQVREMIKEILLKWDDRSRQLNLVPKPKKDDTSTIR
jgi:hypothetical protein